MMKRYPKKQGQQPSQMMSLLFGSKRQTPASPPLSNSKTENSSLSEIKTIWHAMRWLFFHRQYAEVGVALAEYATKTAFSYLPEDQATFYRRWLKFLGMDVDHVEIADVGSSLLDVTFPGIAGSFPMREMFSHKRSPAIVEHIAGSHDTENTLTDTLKSLLMKGSVVGGSTLSPIGKISDVVSSLIHRVQSLTNRMSPEIQSQSHQQFAEYLCGESGWSSGNAKVLPSALADRALVCYNGSHWFDVGLSTLNEMLTEYRKQNPHSHSPPQNVVVLWLEQAYKLWTNWGEKWTPALKEHGHKAVKELAEMERKEMLQRSMSNKGMFVAPIQSTNETSQTQVANTRSRFYY
jgi:hypothetical protein